MVEGVEMSLLIGEVALPFVLAGILIAVIVIIERRERRR